MSTKYTLVCDQCGKETSEGTGQMATSPHGDPDLKSGWYRLQWEMWDMHDMADFCCLKCVAAWAADPKNELWCRQETKEEP